MGGSQGVFKHVDVHGRSLAAVPNEDARLRPPLVCSRIRSEVSGMKHTEVEYDNPTWLTAMQLFEESETSEQQARKTTLVRILHVLLCAWGICRIFCFIGSLQEVRPVTSRF